MILRKFALYIAIVLMLPACATVAEPEAPPAAETTLIVNLEDGSVIMQKIDVGADLCFKNNADTATTCLTRGAAIVDPESNRIIAYEMTEKRIDLVGRSR